MSVVKQFYELQQIDLEIQREQETLADINRQLGESDAVIRAREELIAEEQHLADMGKQQRDAEGEVEDLRNRISQMNEKLYGGKVKNPKELLSLEQEVGILKTNLRQKEDNLLDIMADVEMSQKKIELSAEQLKKREAEWQQEQKALAQRQREIKNRLIDLMERRQSVAADITPEALELYEGTRSKKGQAVVKVEQGRCQRCRLTLAISELQRARAGDIILCSTCGRILYLG
jgi:predicted  nucleic acid-binding Zn-ribbon protein